MITFIDDEGNRSLQIVVRDATKKGARVLLVYEIDLNVVAHEYFNATTQDLEKLHHRLLYPLQYQHSVLELPSMNLSFGLTVVNKGIFSFDVWCYLNGENVRLHYTDYTGCNLQAKATQLEGCTSEFI
jgi:hypothetical protein